MFGLARSLFAADVNDTSPDAVPGSSATSDTQDAFAPLPGAEDDVDVPTGDAPGPSGLGGASAAPSAPSAPGRGHGQRGVGGAGGRGSADRSGDFFSPEPLFQEDDGTDTGGTKRRRPLAQRADVAVVEGSTKIETVADAYDHVMTVMNKQLERGQGLGFKPNESIVGDSAARATFYTLLGDRQQRGVFLEVAGPMQNWPRIRGLFGAPPYSFLRTEDAHMLRAAGIAAGRANMAHEDSQAAASYAQFGTGQMIDAFEREYRVMPRDNVRDSDSVPWAFDVGPSEDIHMQVRVKKRDRKKKMEMLKDSEARKTLTFPRPGDRITLTPTASLLSIQRRRASTSEYTLTVRRIVLRSESSATAALIATLS